jgi:hypothetical protein
MFSFPEMWLSRVILLVTTLAAAPWLEGIEELDTPILELGSGTASEQNAIHIPLENFEVDVLINNSTYPIPAQPFVDGEALVHLDKYQTKGSLPNSLSELSDSLSGYSVPVDPETGESYEYKDPTVLATTTLTFELCANFSEKSQDLEGRGGYTDSSYPAKDIYYDPGFGNAKWEHNSGKTCFQRTIDPIKYPVNPKPLY